MSVFDNRKSNSHTVYCFCRFYGLEIYFQDFLTSEFDSTENYTWHHKKKEPWTIYQLVDNCKKRFIICRFIDEFVYFCIENSKKYFIKCQEVHEICQQIDKTELFWIFDDKKVQKNNLFIFKIWKSWQFCRPIFKFVNKLSILFNVNKFFNFSRIIKKDI